MPHVYAQQIEYMSKHLHDRENVIVSIHPHNDRGTAVASGELALLAGGQRIEGTLFGNGERTGNVDIITMAMNLFTHGVDPQLDFSDMPKIVECYERLTGMSVGYRQPYSGHLVFAAFSGSHQDAIAKGMHFREEREEKYWTVPYPPWTPTTSTGSTRPTSSASTASPARGHLLHPGAQLRLRPAQGDGHRGGLLHQGHLRPRPQGAHPQRDPGGLPARVPEQGRAHRPAGHLLAAGGGSTVADVTLAIGSQLFYLSARGNGPWTP